MPARYDYTASAYRVSCTRCHNSILVRSIHPDTFILDADGRSHGRQATEWIQWHSGHRRFVTRCRECEAQVRRERRAARPQATRGNRVPGTFRSLGVGRRFGVELELIFPSHIGRYDIDSALAAAGLTGWRAKSDMSLSGNGWEIVSPVLAGEDGLEQIKTACRVVKQLGANPNRSCGMHVHHEIRDLNVSQVKQVFHTWATNQHLIDGLVAQSRRGRQRYCGTIRDEELRQVDRAQDLRSIGYLGRFYSNLNLGAYGRYGTLEIRQHQGTCNAEKVISWIRFGQAVIEAAAAGQVTAETSHSRVRDFVTALGTYLDETARTFVLGRAVEFGAVAV